MKRGFLLLAALLLAASARAGGRLGRATLDVQELNAKGFTIIPADALFDPAQVEDVAGSLLLPPTLELASHMYGTQDHFWDVLTPAPDPAHARLLRGAFDMAETLTSYLSKSLPGEDLPPLEAQARAALDTRSAGSHGHTDSGYLTATLSLRGPGTTLYLPRADGGYETVRAPERSIAVVSNRDREAALGVPSGLHSAPPGSMKERVLLLVRFGDAYLPHSEAVARAAVLRELALQRFLGQLPKQR